MRYIGIDIGGTKCAVVYGDENGKILRCDNAAKPTADCIFKNPHDGVLKIFNTVGENIVIAAFNLSDKKQSAAINLKDVYASGEYNMHMYFRKICGEFKDGMKVEIEPHGVEIINLFKGEVGDISKYISIAAQVK